MSAVRIRVSPQEYLAQERIAQSKSEYFAGEVVAMAGTTLAHNAISLNIASKLHREFENRTCRVFVADLRIAIPRADLYVYPDVAALCADPVMSDEYGDCLTNPSVVFEVLSPSSENYDRGLKFAGYRRIASLQQYVLVAQDRPRVESYLREEDAEHWRLQILSGLEAVLELPPLRSCLALAEIYSRVSLPHGVDAP